MKTGIRIPDLPAALDCARRGRLLRRQDRPVDAPIDDMALFWRLVRAAIARTRLLAKDGEGLSHGAMKDYLESFYPAWVGGGKVRFGRRYRTWEEVKERAQNAAWQIKDKLMTECDANEYKEWDTAVPCNWENEDLIVSGSCDLMAPFRCARGDVLVIRMVALGGGGGAVVKLGALMRCVADEQWGGLPVAYEKLFDLRCFSFEFDMRDAPRLIVDRINPKAAWSTAEVAIKRIAEDVKIGNPFSKQCRTCDFRGDCQYAVSPEV